MKQLLIFTAIFLIFNLTAVLANPPQTEIINIISVPDMYDVTIKKVDGKTIIKFDGKFDNNVKFDLGGSLQQYNPDYLELHSEGGYLSQIAPIARIIKEQQIRVRINEGDYCLSACALVAMHSPYVQIDGQMGFHTAYVPRFSAGYSLSDIYQAGSDSAAQLIALVFNAGFPYKLFLDMMYNSSVDEFMTFFNTEEFNSYRMKSPEDFLNGVQLRYLVLSSKHIFAYSEHQRLDLAN